MSNVIRFLETMGSKQLSPAEYAASVCALDVDALHKQALFDRDQEALSNLLGGRSKMCCLIVAPNEAVLK